MAAAATMFVASLGASVTDLGPWYQNLVQPSWKPPDLLFGPAWTIIFGLVAASAVSAWRASPERQDREWVVGLFSFNGLLNLAWSALFFRVKRPDWALWEVVPFWLSVLALVVFCARRSRNASLLLVPYLVWVAFAGALNAAVVSLNR